MWATPRLGSPSGARHHIMSRERVTVVVHAHRWPEPRALTPLVQAAEALTNARVLQVREARLAVGASALIGAAVRDDDRDVLVLAEPCVAWTVDALTDVVTAAREGLALTPALASEATSASTPGRCRLWGIATPLYRALGGLDPRFWSVGELDDLRARAQKAGTSITMVDVRGHWIGPESYPLRPVLRRFLRLRNPLLTTFKTLELDDLGPALTVQLTERLLAAWRAAGIAPSTFRFGAPWSRGWLGRRHHIPEEAPRDEVSTLLPLLAVDSFLADLPDLLSWRRRAGLDRSCPTVPARITEPDVWDPTTDLVTRLCGLVAGPGRPGGSPGAHDGVTRDPTVPAPAPTNPHGPSSSPTSEESPSTVSVIVVNWNGQQHLRACFSSLRASDYPTDQLELILVDNGSTDASVSLMATEFPEVQLVRLDENRGFTGGNNAGVAVAAGEILVFFNNDMRVDPHAISRLVGAIDDHHPCVAARVLSWNGKRIDFVRGTLNFQARGFQDHYGELDRPELSAVRDTFFPNGGAFAITRAAYVASGGFDDRYFAYYDDVDLGWRLRLLGHEIRVATDAVAYHRHGATSRSYPRGQKRFLMERNALWTACKNYGDRTLSRVLAPILLLATKQIVQETIVRRRSSVSRALASVSPACRRRMRAGRPTVDDVYAPDDTDMVTDQHRRTAETGSERPIRRMPLESLAALGVALEGLPDLSRQRRRIQAQRVIPDHELLSTFGRALERDSNRASYVDAQEALEESFGLDQVFHGRSRVLIITHEPLRPNMSGPGVRALEIGRTLSTRLRVTVATPYPPELRDDRCSLAPYSFTDPRPLRRLAEQSDVIVARGFTLAQFPFLNELDIPIAVDLYCPFTLEFLEMQRSRASAEGVERSTRTVRQAKDILNIQNSQLGQGDFFVCASERQRDFWIGALHTAGRVNPLTYDEDPSLRTLIDVVPFGLPDEDLLDPNRGGGEGLATSPTGALKGVYPGIGPTDRVLLWGGSVLDWQDPQTLIRAVAAIAARRDDVKLFFMGIRHPNPQVVPMRVVPESIDLARELGVLDTHVFFNDWVPYAERARYLTDADLGLSTHRDHLETRYSFRTRMLDYIWAQLPIVCTTGDGFAALVEHHGLGLAVPPGDTEALATAICRLLDDDAFRRQCQSRLRELAHEFRWTRVVEPLRRFCTEPRFAADLAPAHAELRARLRKSFRASKWVKRSLLRAGLSEGHFESIKQLALVQMAVRVRNRVARARAERRVRQASDTSQR